MKLSILIVNYNTEQFILNFLQDLQQQNLEPCNYEVIITNNVQNTVLEQTLKNLSEVDDKLLNIKIIQSEHNIGFGRAMNLAATHAKGEHLLIANPDLRMLQPHYLTDLLKSTELHPNYGLMTSQLINDDQEDKSEFYDFEFHETFGFTDQVAWFSGALLLIRKEIMQKVNGFDPDFFMYCEDEDLCLRIKKLGLPLIKNNELKIYHKGGSSEPYQNYDFFYRWYRSQILFAYKHFDSKKFNDLLISLAQKASWKAPFYKSLSLLIPTKRHQFQYAQWSAMQNVCKKTLHESVNWLYFK